MEANALKTAPKWAAVKSGPVCLGMLWLLGVWGCGSTGGVATCLELPDVCGKNGECDPETGQCRRRTAAPCVTHDGCPSDERPVCNGAICVACDTLATPQSADDACASKRLKGRMACVRQGPQKGACGECRLAEHCDATKPVCDKATCRTCQEHAECPKSNVCNLGGGVSDLPDVQVGECAPADKVVFVDADHCPKTGSTGALDKPFCDLPAAVSKAVFIVVKSRLGGLYSGLRLSGGQRTTVVGLSVSGPVQMAPSSVSSTALVLDGVTVFGDTTGVSCGKGGNLWVLRSTIQNAHVGIEALGCNRLHVEQSTITQSKNTGLSVGSGTRVYRVVNNIFDGNGQTAGGVGVFLAQKTSGLFAYNTLLRNGEKGQDGGAIRCEIDGLARRVISSSIVIQNGMSTRVDGSGQPLGTQFGGDCVLQRLVVGLDGTQALPPSEDLIFAIPDLDQALRLLNTPNNRAYVIDNGRADDTVRNDFFGGSRPKGNGFDIGAHELR